VSEEQRPATFASRPRPLADASVERLEGRADELARRWAIALVGARPLAEMTAVPLEEIARVGPALCSALVCALGSEAALDALAPSGDPRTPSAADELRALAARWDAAGTVESVEALRQVVWATAAGELGEAEASSRVAAELSDRLAGVCAVLLGHALPGVASHTATIASQQGATVAAAPSAGQVLYTSSPQPGRSGAVLIDEHGGSHAPGQPQSRPGQPAAGPNPRPLPWDTPPAGPGGAEVRAARTADERAGVRASRVRP